LAAGSGISSDIDVKSDSNEFPDFRKFRRFFVDFQGQNTLDITFIFAATKASTHNTTSKSEFLPGHEGLCSYEHRPVALFFIFGGR